MSSLRALESQVPLGFRSILFATDFSTTDRGALEWLKVMARQLGSSVVLTHFRQIEGRRPGAGQPIELKTADARLRALQDELRQTGDTPASIAEFQVTHEMPFPADAFENQLRDIIKAKGIDLIMLGTHARQGFSRVTLGSFAEGLLRHSDTPVLVVGPKAAKVPPPKLLNKVLFATDFETESIEALPVASALVKRLRSSLVLATVNRLSTRFPNAVALLPELLTAQKDPVGESVNRLHKLADQFGVSDAKIIALQGNPVKQIARAVEQESISMVVLGIRQAEYEDSVAMHIPTLVGKLLSQVACPVLTFRGKHQSHGYQVRPASAY